MAQTETAAAALPVPQFISGEIARLRPVLEADLPVLAALLAEALIGFAWQGEVWTTQHLQRRFDDEQEPGLWGRGSRFYAITDATGDVCGVLHEKELTGRLFLDFHLAAGHPDRDALGKDALAAYTSYSHSWQGHISRIASSVLEFQASEREWLLASGFVWEMRREDAWLHQGEPASVDSYSWLPAWVANNRAADGIGGPWGE